MAGNASLEGKVALITGGGSGIGETCARLLAKQGARVMVADMRMEAAEGVASELGDAVAACGVDVTDPGQCDAMVTATLDAFGRLDVALNVAGIPANVAVDTHETDPDLWRRVLSVNLDGVFYSMRSEIPAMLEHGGAIVNMASALALIGGPKSAAYAASKHGVLGLTRSAAIEYGTRGIRVNAVAPGVTETPLARAAFERNPETREPLIAQHPIGRLGRPEEIAELALFLASDAASFCTGGLYTADGGWTAA